MTKKTLILYHRDELVIQSDSFNYLLCNVFGRVAVSKIFVSPFESIRECLLLRCLSPYCLSERVVFFECFCFIFRIKHAVLNAALLLHVAVGLLLLYDIKNKAFIIGCFLFFLFIFFLPFVSLSHKRYLSTFFFFYHLCFFVLFFVFRQN